MNVNADQAAIMLAATLGGRFDPASGRERYSDGAQRIAEMTASSRAFYRPRHYYRRDDCERMRLSAVRGAGAPGDIASRRHAEFCNRLRCLTARRLARVFWLNYCSSDGGCALSPAEQKL